MSDTSGKSRKRQNDGVLRAGRPPSGGDGKPAIRQHLFLPEAVMPVLDFCKTVMDAQGPSEVFRVALTHYQHALTARELGLRIVARSIQKGDCDLLDALDKELSRADRANNHVTMTQRVVERLTDCCNRAGLVREGARKMLKLSPSDAVAIAIKLLGDYFDAVSAGETVVVIDEGNRVLLGYTPWLDENAMRLAVSASKKAA